MPLFSQTYEFNRQQLGEIHGNLNIHIISLLDMREKLAAQIKETLAIHNPSHVSLYIDARFAYTDQITCDQTVCPAGVCLAFCCIDLLDQCLQVYVDHRNSLHVKQIIFYGGKDMLRCTESFKAMLTLNRLPRLIVKINPGIAGARGWGTDSNWWQPQWKTKPDREFPYNFPEFDLYPATDKPASQPIVTLDEF